MIDSSKLNTIDLSNFAEYIVEEEYRNYFLDIPGREHYKLLAYYSLQFNDSCILDIGTYKGCSALALAFNERNEVKSFDIRSGLRNISNAPSNIEFILDDILNPKYRDLILNSPLILLDTDHLGEFENTFYDYLQNIGYKGLLLLDDIKLNTEMKDFWENITKQKFDLSDVGHHSGTGLVNFN